MSDGLEGTAAEEGPNLKKSDAGRIGGVGSDMGGGGAAEEITPDNGNALRRHGSKREKIIARSVDDRESVSERRPLGGIGRARWESSAI